MQRFNRLSLAAFVPAVALAYGLGAPLAQAEASGSKHTRQAAHVGHQSTPNQEAARGKIVHRQNLRSAKPIRQTLVSLPPPSIQSPDDGPVAPLTSQAVLQSEVAFVQDLESATVLYDKNGDEVRPIASISKLMTALVVAESGQSMTDILEISDADVDRMRYSRSRLPVGAKLSRADMLHLALMSSENRAAHALGRYYPGGMPAFVRAMNDKARALGMRQTRFVEPTGISVENV